MNNNARLTPRQLAGRRTAGHLLNAGRCRQRGERYEFPGGINFPFRDFDNSDRAQYPYNVAEDDGSKLVMLLDGEAEYRALMLETLDNMTESFLSKVSPPNFGNAPHFKAVLERSNKRIAERQQQRRFERPSGSQSERPSGSRPERPSERSSEGYDRLFPRPVPHSTPNTSIARGEPGSNTLVQIPLDPVEQTMENFPNEVTAAGLLDDDDIALSVLQENDQTIPSGNDNVQVPAIAVRPNDRPELNVEQFEADFRREMHTSMSPRRPRRPPQPRVPRQGSRIGRFQIDPPEDVGYRRRLIPNQNGVVPHMRIVDDMLDRFVELENELYGVQQENNANIQNDDSSETQPPPAAQQLNPESAKQSNSRFIRSQSINLDIIQEMDEPNPNINLDPISTFHIPIDDDIVMNDLNDLHIDVSPQPADVRNDVQSENVAQPADLPDNVQPAIVPDNIQPENDAQPADVPDNDQPADVPDNIQPNNVAQVNPPNVRNVRGIRFIDPRRPNVNRPIEQIRFNPEQALRLPTDDEITAHLRLVNNGPDKTRYYQRITRMLIDNIRMTENGIIPIGDYLHDINNADDRLVAMVALADAASDDVVQIVVVDNQIQGFNLKPN